MSHLADMSGLGIDMGSPSSIASSTASSTARKPTKRAHDQQHRPRSMHLPESLNQYNEKRRSAVPVRRPTTNSERKVRIASGQPEVQERDTGAPANQTKQYASGPMNRNSRLGAAVIAMGDQMWDSSSAVTPSDLYSPSETSPHTDSSATSYPSSAGSNSLKRSITIRKQVSQPNLSRASTVNRGASAPMADDRVQQQLQQQRSRGPPSPDDAARSMVRSKSSMSLASQYRTSTTGASMTLSRSTTSGSTSLGRTSEIPRSGSRASARGGRGGGAPNRRATWDPRPLLLANEPQEIKLTTDGKRMVPDGFGGFVEEHGSDQDAVAEQPAPQQRNEQPQQQPTRIAVHQESAQRPAPTVLPQQPQQMANLANRGVRPRSLTLGAQPPPAALRVGSFYGPDGQERARINNDGRLSQMGVHRNSVSSSGNGASEAPSQQHSNASSRSSAPRLQFMDSPATTRRENGASVASGVTASSADVVARSERDVMLQRSYSMRSKHGFLGLSAAERGETMVSLDMLNDTARGTSGYSEGEAILPGRTRTMDDESILQSARLDKRDSIDDGEGHAEVLPVRPAFHGHRRQASAPAGMTNAGLRQNATTLDRHGTLIASGTNPSRRSKDLSRLLGNNSGKLSSSASDAGSSVSGASASTAATSSSANSGKAHSNVSVPQAVLEHGRSGKGRVDVDLVLESELVIEGGMLTGRLEIKVRKNSTKDGHLMLSQPKVRVVGFEELVNDDTRHIFYHYATVIDGSPKVGTEPSRPYVLHGSPCLSSPEFDNRKPLACFASTPDAEGYSVAKEGHHSVPFALELPVGKGAKGSYRGKHAVVRYIVIGSVKLKSANGSNRSIAHFYRHIDLYPYLNPAVVLSSSPRPVQARASKGLFLGGSGKVHLTASLHRHTWVAGQRLYVHLRIDNGTNKKVKSLSMALVRTVVLYRPRPEFDLTLGAPHDPSETYIDPDACTTSTSRKKIYEDVLEMGQKGSKGSVTARGWWTGVEAGDAVELSHNMKLPVDALTIVRGRHVEVVYSLKVSVGSSLSSDVSVEVPLRIVNFVSLDPPPLKSSIKAISTGRGGNAAGARNAVSDSEAPMIERVRSMEALRSPQRQAYAFQTQPVAAGQYVGRYLNPAQSGLTAQQPTRQSASTSDRDTANARHLQHQKSLDFINHAIRSATARRGGSTSSNEPSPTGLGIEVDEARTPLAGSSTDDSASSVSSGSRSEYSNSEVGSAVHPSCQPYQHKTSTSNMHPPIVSVSGLVGGPRPLYMPSHAVSLDEADEDSDEEYDAGEQTINLNDESVADIDMVIGSAQIDGGESSPDFAQHRGMTAFGGDVTLGDEDQSDISSSTVTSNDGGAPYDDEEDEFDEEEERYARQMRLASEQQLADDGPTPIAKSPPKFQSLNVRPSIGQSRESFGSATGSSFSTCSSSSASSSAYSVSSSAISTNSAEALAEAKREGKTVVRTRSDLEKALGRSSTIIRGPSSNGTRPVSPSKNAPSPTKSALKGKSSFTFATNERPLKQQQQVHATAPLTLRAKVDPRQALQPGSEMISPSRRPAQRTVHTSDSEDMASESSASPATSASVLTPREGLSDIESDTDGQKRYMYDGDRTMPAGLGLQLDPIVQSVAVAESALPVSKSMSEMVSSTSTRTLRGSNVVVPSVRDKIAMLESRKRALKELTGGQEGQGSPASASPRNATVMASDALRSTPPISSRTVRANGSGSGDPDTPTRVQVAARSFLERNNSIQSSASSATTAQPDYMRNIPSVQNFKAPLFR